MLDPLQIRAIAILVAIAAFYSGLALWLLQHPSPSAREASNPPQTQTDSGGEGATNEPRGTERAPFIVRSMKSKEEAAQDAEDREDKASTERWNKVFSGAVAIGTLLQFSALIVIILTTRRQLRAYVLATAVYVEKFKAGEEPRAKVTIKNTGQTPAYELTQWSGMGLDQWPPITDPPMDDPAQLPIRPLGPQQEMFSEPTLGRTLNAAEVSGLKSGALAIYVIGRIRYVDAFRRSQVTEYRVFTGGPIGLREEMAGYHQGNRAT